MVQKLYILRKAFLAVLLGVLVFGGLQISETKAEFWIFDPTNFEPEKIIIFVEIWSEDGKVSNQSLEARIGQRITNYLKEHLASEIEVITVNKIQINEEKSKTQNSLKENIPETRGKNGGTLGLHFLISMEGKNFPTNLILSFVFDNIKTGALSVPDAWPGRGKEKEYWFACKGLETGNVEDYALCRSKFQLDAIIWGITHPKVKTIN